MELDLKKIKKVNIDDVRPNDYNPKEKNHIKVQQIKKSIELMGFKQPVQVRDNNGYEILDGEQRWTAMKELGAKEIYIYDNGKVSDEEAKAETLRWQVQIPFDEVQLAPLVVELANLNIDIPFNEEEIEDYRKITEFDFNQYNANRPDFEEEDGVKTLSIKMTEEAYNVVMRAIKKLQEDIPDAGESRAIELICADYLGD
jgi:hypothetical protein